mmetsp:Transcript_14271/g.36821  ORF Transcript_14271/g.36821 Transcript_14271/m.36821 type:complete len:484 (-) Transcript_14271:1738-3189(-)
MAAACAAPRDGFDASAAGGPHVAGAALLDACCQVRWFTVCSRDGPLSLGGCAVPVSPPPPFTATDTEAPSASDRTTAATATAAAAAVACTPTAAAGGGGTGRKAKRRRTEPNQGEKEMAARHDRLRGVIAAEISAALSGLVGRGTPPPAPVAAAASTSTTIRPFSVAPTEAGGGFPRSSSFSFAAACTDARRQPFAAPLTLRDDDRGSDPRPVLQGTDIINRVVGAADPSRGCAFDVAGVGTVVLPPHARFVCSDVVAARAGLRTLGDPFDLIVVDPPWQNKSVARGGGGYGSLDNDALENLPVAKLCRRGTLVAVWCTNKPKHLRFVVGELFRAWGVGHIGTMQWVKLTAAGEYSHPLDSPHKKPYEPVLLGRCGGDAAGPRLPLTPRCFASVPSVQHSRKPVLLDVLSPLLATDRATPSPRCLELFGRNLLPGWTTWGNDVLRFQTVGHDGLRLASRCDHCAAHTSAEASPHTASLKTTCP